MSAKKKPIKRTIPDVKSAPARSVSRGAPRAPEYPTAAELLAHGPEWKTWLLETLDAVLKPAALASVVSLAAAGCSNPAEALGLLDEEAPVPVYFGAVAPTDKPTVATLAPSGDPYSPPPTFVPEAMPPCPLPPTTPIGTHPSWPRPPGRPPTPHIGSPPTPDIPMPGGIRPVMPPVPPPAHPPLTRGGARPVMPVPPPVAPPAANGGGPAVAPVPHPPAIRGEAPAVAPILPAAEPPEIEGDIAMVRPTPL